MKQSRRFGYSLPSCWVLVSWLLLLPLAVSVGQPLNTNARQTFLDSLPTRPATFRWVTPAVLLSTGLALSPDYPNSHFDRFYVRSELQDKIHFRTQVDNYLQYGPMIGWAGLSLAGVKGRSQPLDRAGIALVAHGIMTVVVLGLKQVTHELRPDLSDSYSFPSGHTALAFTGAGLLDREFGGVSPWIPIGGYAMATSTGILRMTNDKHWISDVLVGAGIGLLSTEVAYQVYPWLKRKLVRRKSTMH
ncbi:phosphatase PAP2 family protein [Spirosoma pollinicola]|uniref:PAP2 family protein n=1 Tax=Spirosoma pollinicola TaxID=2057025 RepID=A0A2K8Z681_9BACT|nr:phosphatase PAP2 family protein [Spirosoma pollinicola]AUD05397.1 PAP2 family protein [Spirosoma pollinicola]